MERVKGLVSVILVNWNGRSYIPACFESISLQTYKKIETILVDNASTDASVTYVRKRFPNTIVIENSQNTGFAKGNNIGLQHATGEYILLLNTDTKLSH